MRALSIRQPHLHRIINKQKTFEIRSWNTKYRGELLLCASRSTKDCSDIDKTLPRGCALAVVKIKNVYPFLKCHEKNSCIAWQPNLYAWEIEIVEKIKPFPVKGKLGFFEVAV